MYSQNRFFCFYTSFLKKKRKQNKKTTTTTNVQNHEISIWGEGAKFEVGLLLSFDKTHITTSICSILTFVFNDPTRFGSKIFKQKQKQKQKTEKVGIIYFDKACISYAAVNGHLELTLLKGRQSFDAISTSNLEVCKFRDGWIFTYFIFWHDESSPNNNWSMVNLERTCVLLFYYFLYFKVNLDLEKTNQLGESSPIFIFAVVNLDPIILEKRCINGKSWPNDVVEKVNRGEELRWVGSRCLLTCALTLILMINSKFRPSFNIPTTLK